MVRLARTGGRLLRSSRPYVSPGEGHVKRVISAGRKENVSFIACGFQVESSFLSLEMALVSFDRCGSATSSTLPEGSAERGVFGEVQQCAKGPLEAAHLRPDPEA